MTGTVGPPAWPVLATAAAVLVLGYGIPLAVDAAVWLLGVVRGVDDQLADDFGGDD